MNSIYYLLNLTSQCLSGLGGWELVLAIILTPDKFPLISLSPFAYINPILTIFAHNANSDLDVSIAHISKIFNI